MSGGERKRAFKRLFAAIAVVTLAPIIYGGLAPAEPLQVGTVCPPGQLACTDAAGRKQPCKDHSTDRRSCGSCGNVCRDNDKCVAGACTSSAPQCPPGQLACTDAAGRKQPCKDHSTDRSSCGSCGNVCRGNDKCVAGACTSSAPQCPPGQLACTDAAGRKQPCKDHSTDRSSCGTCGNVCRDNDTCVAGACTSSAPQCPPGQLACMDAAGRKQPCKDHSTDRNNCGTCGKACPPDQKCHEGTCQ